MYNDPQPVLAPAIRSWIYSVLTPLAALVAFYGIATEEEAALWTAIVLAAIHGGTAIAYRPTRSALPSDNPVAERDGGFVDNGVVWTIVGVLAIIALLIYIIPNLR